MCISKSIYLNPRMLILPLVIAVYVFYGYTTGFLRHGHNGYYYAKLGEAFADGQTYLHEVPPKEILALRNPYNPHERKQKKVNYFWDMTLYDGKYYVYFGPVPAVIPWLPVKWITGFSLADYSIVLFYALLGTLSLMLLLFLIADKLKPPSMSKRWFNIIWFIAALPLCFGTTIPSLIKSPTIYQAAIGGAYAYVALGLLCLWLAYAEKMRRPTLWKCLASLCFALASGCRLFHAASVMILFFCWLSQYEGKTVKEWFKEGVLLAASWLIIIGIIAGYNFVRFGSPFETGIAYQLTQDDQQNFSQQWSYKYFPKYSVAYLFDVIPKEYLFPWYDKFGKFSTNKQFGMFTHSSFVVWLFLGLFTLCRRSTFKEIHTAQAFALYYYTILSFIFVSSFFYIQTRYMVDFAPWFMLLASISYLYCTLGAKAGWQQNTLIILGALTSLWTVYSGLAPFSCIKC